MIEPAVNPLGSKVVPETPVEPEKTPPAGVAVNVTGLALSHTFPTAVNVTVGFVLNTTDAVPVPTAEQAPMVTFETVYVPLDVALNVYGEVVTPLTVVGVVPFVYVMSQGPAPVNAMFTGNDPGPH